MARIFIQVQQTDWDIWQQSRWLIGAQVVLHARNAKRGRGCDWKKFLVQKMF